MKAEGRQQVQARPRATVSSPRSGAAGHAEASAAVAQSPFVVAQRKQLAGAFGPVLQRQEENETGMPDSLKSGVESLSGMAMDNVRVHYNSGKPRELNALAYAQGSDIHLGPGQEKHLPHEAWHVVQQAQGRVRPTMQAKSGTPINDDKGLEREADVMGERAVAQRSAMAGELKRERDLPGSAAQRKADEYGAEELIGKQAQKEGEGIPEAPLGAALKFQRFRKLNRIGGALKKREGVAGISPIVSDVKSIFDTVRTTDALTATQALSGDAVYAKSLKAVQDAAEPAAKVGSEAFEAYSMLGPLDYWLHNQTSHSDLEAALRALRLKMAERPGVSIIAHRGHGPTNRTRGGLIKQDDARRTGRPAENSKSAFSAAFGEVTESADVPALDGIECDVFLSSDLVPILSHEGAVKEQLSLARQTVHNALVTAATQIEDLSAEQLKSIQRTESPESAFLTLGEFLNETKDTAKAYFEATGKPLRVEIEMKGHAKEGSVIADYGQKLLTNVAKIISKFKKANPQPYWEIILFNNEKDDAKKFGELRTRKSHLGGLYTGLGSNSTKHGREAKVDELRVSAATTNLLTEKNFIVTYVPGAERPFDTPNAKLGALEFGAHQKPEYVEKVNADMADETGTEQTRIKGLLDQTKTAKNVHLLTDIPANAAKYKEYQSRESD